MADKFTEGLWIPQLADGKTFRFYAENAPVIQFVDGEEYVAGAPVNQLKNPLRRPYPYQFWGRYGAVVYRYHLNGATRAFGESSDVRYGAPAFYRPFGVEYRVISYPEPFPLENQIPLQGGIVGYGTGNEDNPFSCVLTDTGRYYYAGRNFRGAAAGNRAFESSIDLPAAEVYTQTATTPFDASTVVHFAVAGYGVLALTMYGQVWVTGGRFLAGNPTLPEDLPDWTLIHEKCIWAEIALNGVVVITEEGQVKFTGSATNGRFGDGNTSGIYRLWYTPDTGGVESVPGGIVKALLGDDGLPLYGAFSLLLGKDGSVWFSGDNRHRQCGDASVSSITTLTTFQKVPGLPPIADIAANEAACYALDRTGRVWVWGSRRFDTIAVGSNALGTGETGINEEEPTPFVLLSRCIQIHAARDCGYAVRSNECIYGWGCAEFSNTGTGRLNQLQVMRPRSQCLEFPDLTARGIISGGSPAVLLTANPPAI